MTKVAKNVPVENSMILFPYLLLYELIITIIKSANISVILSTTIKWAVFEMDIFVKSLIRYGFKRSPILPGVIENVKLDRNINMEFLKDM